MSSMPRSVQEFLSALADRRTYSIRNPYALFGFLWGLPIPIFSIGLDLLATNRAPTLGEIAGTFAARPVHFLFLAHPVLFAVVFGAMGTVKLIKDARIQEQVRELALANEKLTELDRLKKEFIANVTHELKTPLVAILGYLEMFDEGRLGPLDDRQKNALAVAFRSAQRLEKLIEELLEMARLEGGRVTLEKRTFELREVVDTVVRSFEPAAAQKSLKFSVSFAEAPVRVHADPERIQRVVSNLVSNAIKFTDPGGSVAIRVGAPREGKVFVTVKDTGRGIPESFKPYLFQRFSRAHNGPGTGLGLAIVKAILDAHGSAIQVQSREGEGTEITFSLECAAQGD